MDASVLYKLIEDASLFSNETLTELKTLVNRYPTFATLKTLYLKNLSVLNDPDFLNELKRLSTGIADRRKLFLLIEDKLEWQSSITMLKEEEREDKFGLIDSFLSNQDDRQSREWEDQLLGASVSSDYVFWSMPKDSGQKEEENKLQHHQLIDSFIKNKKERPGRPLNAGQDAEDPIPGPDLTKAQDDAFFTETLAQIYIKQKRYERALQIIEKLSLKYPEKNVYFADQIRFLEKLIINNKNIK